MGIVSVLVMVAIVLVWRAHRWQIRRRRQECERGRNAVQPPDVLPAPRRAADDIYPEVRSPSRAALHGADVWAVIDSAAQPATRRAPCALTEDDVIAFGLAMESVEDVIAQVLAEVAGSAVSRRSEPEHLPSSRPDWASDGWW